MYSWTLLRWCWFEWNQWELYCGLFLLPECNIELTQWRGYRFVHLFELLRIIFEVVWKSFTFSSLFISTFFSHFHDLFYPDIVQFSNIFSTKNNHWIPREKLSFLFFHNKNFINFTFLFQVMFVRLDHIVRWVRVYQYHVLPERTWMKHKLVRVIRVLQDSSVQTELILNPALQVRRLSFHLFFLFHTWLIGNRFLKSRFLSHFLTWGRLLARSNF